VVVLVRGMSPTASKLRYEKTLSNIRKLRRAVDAVIAVPTEGDTRWHAGGACVHIRPAMGCFAAG